MERNFESLVADGVDSENEEIERQLEMETRRRAEYVAFIEEKIQDPKNYIDKGGAGKVYRLSEKGVCIKIIVDRHEQPNAHEYNLGTHPESEAHFMEVLGSFGVGSVRSPKLLEYFKAYDKEGKLYHAIIMEEIDAVNLQHIMNGTKEMPKNMDPEAFFDEIEEYIDALHIKMEMTHGDNELRNMMVGREEGRLYMIDFGRSESLRGKTKEQKERLKKKDWDIFERVRKEFLEKKFAK
ncbi:MAG: hypothetical protein KC736_05160 [Candidatus Moranbacteria bacterium]|nr:hypothetical protein [Candidatus Moranbacteria bacterium]